MPHFLLLTLAAYRKGQENAVFLSFGTFFFNFYCSTAADFLASTSYFVSHTPYTTRAALYLLSHNPGILKSEYPKPKGVVTLGKLRAATKSLMQFILY